MKLDKNTYGTVLLVYLFGIIAITAFFLFIDYWWISVPLTIFVVWFCGWQTLFHMVPVRNIVGTDKLVTAVADGRIVFVDNVFEKEWLGKEMTMISIYMDFWDIHANFWPVNGKISYYNYHPGKHFFAFKPKASEENEHTCTSIKTAEGTEIFFKQLAGGFARRIVNYAKEGMEVNAGSQCGIIKFGSRIDMFLPTDAEILVKVGQVVRACETAVARI